MFRVAGTRAKCCKLHKQCAGMDTPQPSAWRFSPCSLSRQQSNFAGQSKVSDGVPPDTETEARVCS